jgi:hypothetical protein
MLKLFNNCPLKVGLFFIASVTIIAYAYVQGFAEERSTEFWNGGTGEQVSYLYAPGLMATEMAMGRYCPEFTAITGEKFTFKKGGHVIGQPHRAVIFPEIDLRKPTYFTFNPITWYINKIRDDLFPLFFRIFRDTYKFEVEENPNSPLSVINYTFNFGQANGGQKEDIKAIHTTYHDLLKQNPDVQIVVYGDSRGSAALFNFLAQHNPSNVKAAVLESVYDDMDHYIKHLFYTDKDEKTENRLHNIYSLLVGKFKRKGMSARKSAEIITDDTPKLLVGSLRDSLVAPQCVIYLYKRLIERGHKQVHLLMLKSSSHPGYMLDNQEDKEVYEAVVHAFYKHYNLPHNKQKAMLGKGLFAATQPSLEEIDSLYNLEQCAYCWKAQ